jgi:Fic family protein
MPQAAIAPGDRRTDAVVEMMLDATHEHAAPLTPGRLFGWQSALFPTGYAGLQRVKVGGWREGSVRVVSGPAGRKRIHFEGPPGERLDAEMGRFLEWFNGPPEVEGLIRAAISHLWFVTIHPFEDGNGRIARAIADMALAQTEGSSQRFYSISSQIRRERDDYYGSLEQAQKGNLDITDQLVWFLRCFSRAIDGADLLCADVLRKADFWQRYAGESLTDRQKIVLNRFLDGFEGKLTARKWAAIGKCSIASAQRDISDLLERGIFKRNEGGSKNSSYEVTQ